MMRGQNLYKHGLYQTPLYIVWLKMKDRCNNPHDVGYANYGGRGITISEEWNNDFVKFYEWAINNGYAKGLFLDRIDNEKGYSPDNCRFVTRKENNNNKRNNILLTVNGKTQTIAQWAEETGIKYWTLYRRVKRGLSPEKCVCPVAKVVR